MDWDKLRIFHVVAMTGSFTHGGEKLGLSQSAISRQIRSLEESLNTSLFNRHARGLSLTNEGEVLFKTAEEVVSKIHVTEQQLIEGTNIPRGELRLTTTISFGSTWLMGHIQDFTEQYPDIDLQILLSDQNFDLSRRQADIAIRFHPSHHQDLIQRPLGVFHHNLYASPDYLKRKGTPLSLEDLDHHDLITYGDTPSSPIRNIDWILNKNNGELRTPKLRINNIYGVLQAVKAGMGIAALPDYLVSDNQRVIRVMKDTEGPTFQAYLLYTQELRRSKRITAFKDYIVDQFKHSRF